MTLGIKNKGFLKRLGGFTLIELIITLALSAVLSAMAIPAAYNYIEWSQAVKTVKEMKAIAAAENLFYQSNTTPLGCTITIFETNYNETELYHIYTPNFSDLVNAGALGNTASDINYFGQNYYLQPVYGGITVNLNNYCVRSAGILVYTYIPVQFKGAVSGVSGAFVLGASGNMEEIGYYMIPEENNPERDVTLKYNW